MPLFHFIYFSEINIHIRIHKIIRGQPPKLPMNILSKRELGELSTFIPNKKTPVYNWFYYKERFARELVSLLLDQFEVQQGAFVLDPFCGSGTTLLACKERGINAQGLDVLPISVFSANVKTRDYNLEALREGCAAFLKQKYSPAPLLHFPSIFRRVFTKYALQDIAFFMQRLEAVDDIFLHDFILLALINASMKVSFAWKDGASIKVKEHPSPPLRFMLKRVLRKMLKDIERFHAKKCEVHAQLGDARKLPFPDATFDAVITSPPYLNQIDYTKVYEIENWFIEKQMQSLPALRSYFGIRAHEEFGPAEWPLEAKAYFKDISEMLRELQRVCKPGAHIAIVIGNGYAGGEIFESDLQISEFAKEIGFEAGDIWVLNERYALGHRTEKKGILRESIVFLKRQ